MAWKWVTVGNGWDGLTVELVDTDDTWHDCEYYCSWNDGDERCRGLKGVPHRHEHLNAETLISGWGYDASGLIVTDEVMEQIIREHEAASSAERTPEV